MNSIKVNTQQNTSLQAVSAELYKEWIEYIDATPKTIETYKRAIRQFMTYTNTLGITQPQRADIIAYKEYLLTGHKPTTVQIYLEAVKLFFRWTERAGLYPNIADHVKGVQLDTEHKKDNLTQAQTTDLLQSIDRDTLQGARDYALIALMVTTGLRTISIARANVEDLRTAGESTVLYYQGKGHAERAEYVKLADPVREAITDYIKMTAAKSGDPLFTSQANRNAGERMTTRSISRVIKNRLIAVGLDSDRLTAHSLRHTAATLNLLNGATVEETRQLLDHKNINTTLIYSHALERASNNSEYRIAAAIF